jgi:hypothetical protein
MKPEKVKKELVTRGKYIHVTIHKITNPDKQYWVDKALTFRCNVQAVLVGIENNQDEEKGLHVHIMIQFTTRPSLSRRQFVNHFGSDSLHISVKVKKDDLMDGLGYVSKTGNVASQGTFTYRNVPITEKTDVYKFKYQVKKAEDAMAYFRKDIQENIDSPKSTMENIAIRNDEIGDYVRQRPTMMRSLIEVERKWKIKRLAFLKQGIKFYDWVDDQAELKSQYNRYLEEFPEIFVSCLTRRSGKTLSDLETDYKKHADNDLKNLLLIKDSLLEAQRLESNRPRKSLNLYIWSTKPSFGKTRLLEAIENRMVTYRLPEDQYYTDYENMFYSVLLSDEAKKSLVSKTYSHIKALLEGAICEFNRKGKTKIIKRDNPLIIMADNDSLDNILTKKFGDGHDSELIEDRCLDLEIKSRATLHFFVDRCMEPVEKIRMIACGENYSKADDAEDITLEEAKDFLDGK